MADSASVVAKARELTVLADDLTGALECGAAFAQRGVRAIVTFGGCCKDAPVIVVDTETRHVPPEVAAARVAQFVAQNPARLLYKKTDSTLRGNIRAELESFSTFGPVTYVPAYPRMGRTVHAGHLHVDGVPVEETSFALDPTHPILDGNLERLLVGIGNIKICQANTEAEIEEVAHEWLCAGGLAAGPAAMLHASARLMNPSPHPLIVPKTQKALVVLGSRNSCSLRQVEVASKLFSQTSWELLQADQELQGSTLAFADRFGAAAVDRLISGRFDTCIVLGGDTAYATLRRLGCVSLEPLGEVLPGLPVALVPDICTLVTKAGGFGPPDILLQLHQQLTHV